jgi:hypothetical protein
MNCLYTGKTSRAGIQAAQQAEECFRCRLNIYYARPGPAV